MAGQTGRKFSEGSNEVGVVLIGDNGKNSLNKILQSISWLDGNFFFIHRRVSVFSKDLLYAENNEEDRNMET